MLSSICPGKKNPPRQIFRPPGYIAFIPCKYGIRPVKIQNEMHAGANAHLFRNTANLQIDKKTHQKFAKSEIPQNCKKILKMKTLRISQKFLQTDARNKIFEKWGNMQLLYAINFAKCTGSSPWICKKGGMVLTPDLITKPHKKYSD